MSEDTTLWTQRRLIAEMEISPWTARDKDMLSSALSYHYHYHRTSAWLLIFISDLHAYEGLEKYYTAHIEVRQGIYKINNVVLQFLILNL